MDTRHLIVQLCVILIDKLITIARHNTTGGTPSREVLQRIGNLDTRPEDGGILAGLSTLFDLQL